jgi:putative aldouronate transport system substrate-binding protein
MDRGLSHGSPSSPHLTRRGFLTAAAGATGAVAAAPLLAACGTSSPAKAGASSQSAIDRIMPAYMPRTIAGITPEYPSINGSEPGYLTYPATLVHTVTEVPGSGGSYTGVSPYWGSIPRTVGNTYYDALNTAIGATLNVQPTNGNLVTTTLPTLFAGNKLPDWIDIPTWAEPPAFGQAVAVKLADLTPYLAGDKVKQYPNLAAIPSGGWQAGIWNNAIYGIPTAVTEFTVGVYLYYRADVLDKLGIGTPSITSISDLYNLGKEINDPSAKRWAFDDIWSYLYQPFGIPSVWTTNDKGDLITQYETENIIDAMNWASTIFKAGMVNPDAVAGDTSTAKQRFWSGQEIIYADGQGAWDYADAQSGQAANKGYVRAAVPFFNATGTGTPSIPLEPATGYVSYFNKDLKPSQIEELLRIANFLAGPFGSYEYTLVNYGAENTDWTMSSQGPVLTATGSKDVDAAAVILLASPQNVINNPGYAQVTTASATFGQQNAKYGFKPLFYALNVTVPSDLTSAYAFTPFTETANIMYEVERGRATIADYQSTLNEWLRNGGSKLKAFMETVRAKYGDA